MGEFGGGGSWPAQQPATPDVSALAQMFAQAGEFGPLAAFASTVGPGSGGNGGRNDGRVQAGKWQDALTFALANIQNRMNPTGTPRSMHNPVTRGSRGSSRFGGTGGQVQTQDFNLEDQIANRQRQRRSQDLAMERKNQEAMLNFRAGLMKQLLGNMGSMEGYRNTNQSGMQEEVVNNAGLYQKIPVRSSTRTSERSYDPSNNVSLYSSLMNALMR